MRFKLNSPYIAYDIIEEEAVIVNLRQGHYYSLRGSGVEIWTAFVNGLSLEEVIARLKNRYAAEPAVIEASVRELLEAFTKEQFFLPLSAEELKVFASPSDGGVGDAPPAPGKTFVPSRIEKFTDMEDILLLDPIHDVDDKGWPNRIDKKE